MDQVEQGEAEALNTGEMNIVMICGHTHKPYRRDLSGKIFINAGSVGKSKDGDRRACAALLEITSEGNRSDFLRVPYDVEKMAEAIIASGLPPRLAENLKNGM